MEFTLAFVFKGTPSFIYFYLMEMRNCHLSNLKALGISEFSIFPSIFIGKVANYCLISYFATTAR